MLGTVAIFPIAGAIAVISKKRFEETVFPAIGVIILSLMCMGLAGFLSAGLFLVFFWGGVSLVVLIVRRSRIKEYVATPGFMAFCFLFFFFIVFSYGRYFTSNEAYSQFGPTVLNLYNTNSFMNVNEYYTLNNPFPFSTLWSYYCVRTNGGFSEWICIFSNDIYILAAMMPLFKPKDYLKKKHRNWILSVLFCLMIPVLKLPDAYSDYNMAVPQAVTLVYTLLMCNSLLEEGTETADTIFVSFGIFASCTLTKFGAYAAIPLIVGISAIGLYMKKKKHVLIAVISGSLLTMSWSIFNYFHEDKPFTNVIIIPVICLCSILCAVCIERAVEYYRNGKKILAIMLFAVLFFCMLAGTMYMLWHSVHRNYAIEKIMEFSDKLCIECSEESQYIVGKNTIKLYDAVFLFLALAVSGIVCGILQKKRDIAAERIYVFNFAFAIGTCLYFIVLLIVYINIIREPPRAVPVPTIAEYIVPIILLSFIVVYLEVDYLCKNETVLLLFVCFLIICEFSDPIKAITGRQERPREYESINFHKQNGDLEFCQNDRIFYIDVDLVEPVPKYFGWLVFPAGTDSINGLNYNPDPYRFSDIEQTITDRELEAVLRDGKYTYIYINHVDEFFKSNYQDVFAGGQREVEDDTLYKVGFTESGQMHIDRMNFDPVK